MTHELTMDGLFSYFDPNIVEKIIELSLVKRHLSVHNYLCCKEACSQSQISLKYLHKEKGEPFQAILSFDVLQHASIDELVLYLSIAEIKAAYLHCYGEYFAFFELKMFALKDKLHPNYDDLCPMLDLVSEKKIILHIQAAMALPLNAFTNALLEQHLYLEEIASQLTYQAGEARQFIAAIQADDEKYKQTVVNISFSVIKIGLSVFHADELINVSQSLYALASGTFDKIENKLSSLVSDIQKLVIKAHLQALQEAEKELLSDTAPEDISLRWSKYRSHIFHRSNELIKSFLDACVNNDYFFRCVIRETIYQHKELTQEMLLIHATEKSRQYVVDIVKGLQSQVMKVQHIRDSVRSPQGMKRVEFYFRRLCLINYTMSHEHTENFTQSWLTKKLGHRLSFYFPDIVFQKKWAPVKLQNIFHHGVKYCKQKMTLKEYQSRRRNSSVVLGLFRNSSHVKEELFSTLESQITILSDQLIKELQQQDNTLDPVDVCHQVDDCDSTRKKQRYSFGRRQLSLFSFHEPDVDSNVNKSIQQAVSPLEIVFKRTLVEE